jgi:hypothetical protein
MYGDTRVLRGSPNTTKYTRAPSASGKLPGLVTSE